MSWHRLVEPRQRTRLILTRDHPLGGVVRPRFVTPDADCDTCHGTGLVGDHGKHCRPCVRRRPAGGGR